MSVRIKGQAVLTRMTESPLDACRVRSRLGRPVSRFPSRREQPGRGQWWRRGQYKQTWKAEPCLTMESPIEAH